ncbi:hypothetical protein VPNG_04201 [Cytospora leucostoma]|uniref:Uncharacterized protein n=1 Tax=Cytospora leucostoma TaxID=1230097 RepID=A0A423XDP1_9PEZI|nr:hypothetical protein VPNG_04201 [Cytospora leucostoma]
MSNRPHPLRQAYTVDYSIDRQPSTTSSASSGYSQSSSQLDLSRTTTLSSSDSNGYGSMGHRRGKSEAISRLPPSPKSPDSRPQTSAGNVYSPQLDSNSHVHVHVHIHVFIHIDVDVAIESQVQAHVHTYTHTDADPYADPYAYSSGTLSP